MKRFVEGGDRNQSTLLPERLEDYIVEDNHRIQSHPGELVRDTVEETLKPTPCVVRSATNAAQIGWIPEPAVMNAACILRQEGKVRGLNLN